MIENKLVWAEHYRPKTVSECILPESVINDIKQIISSGSVPHFLFTGTAGTGKTTLARAICNELGADLLFINASLNRSIDDIRTKVMQFASTVSFDGGLKVILLDEVDGLTRQAQDSLRGVYEEFGNVRFFLTCNFKNKIIEALQSRSSIIDFRLDPSERAKMMARFFKRVLTILDEREVEYDKKVVAELVSLYFPDFRRTLNELQRYSSGGKIDAGILANTSKENFKTLINGLKAKDFKEVRKWVGTNSDIDQSILFRDLYENGYDYFDGKSLAQAILIMADYQNRAANGVVDLELNTMAAMTELMINCDFK
jgi:replication factor C small subunit